MSLWHSKGRVVNTAPAFQTRFIDEMRKDVVVTFSLKGNTLGVPVLLEWWSRHQLNENQKIALCLAHQRPVSIILRNVTFLNQEIFAQHIENAIGFPYVVAPGRYLKYARTKGLHFGTFYMHNRHPENVYQVVHFEDTEEKIMLTGNDVFWAKTRYNN